MTECFIRKAETSAGEDSGETDTMGIDVDASAINTSFLRFFFLSFFAELISAASSSSLSRFRFLFVISGESELAGRRVVVTKFFGKNEM